jgi:CxxC-x17-CxxC domain-containing protein
MFEIKCSNCGKTDTVPFEPKADKPVYCSSCFSEERAKRQKTRTLSFGFNEKNAWARRHESFKGRKEEKPSSVFQKD